tara:strand:+ start:200 stop:571 length:372 start_codon:yes stop_codon:yes gene_type:complete
MHLVGPHMTTTRYNRKRKKPNAKQQRAQAEHDKWLTKMGVHPDQLAEKKANRKDVKNKDIPIETSTDSKRIRTSDSVAGIAPKKDRQQYTGDYIIGIATTHKSNLMPVTSRKQAVEASTMRRN